jgi:hypothetical protein
VSGKRTAEEWGQVAVALPGWRWMAGMLARRMSDDGRPLTLMRPSDRSIKLGMLPKQSVPSPDDPATEGCLLRLLGMEAEQLTPHMQADCSVVWTRAGHSEELPLGQACIAIAEAEGCWPGGQP